MKLRKKSHISLAKYILNDMQFPIMQAHRKAFYIGNVLPDCKPSFITQRHEFFETFDMIKREISNLSEADVLDSMKGRIYVRHLGEVIHYIADYFTFPHNIHYEGNIKDHCIYEKYLKFRIREYVKSKEVYSGRINTDEFTNAEAIFEYVQKAHEEYLSKKRNVDEDCYFIVLVCSHVVQAILHLAQQREIRTASYQLVMA